VHRDLFRSLCFRRDDAVVRGQQPVRDGASAVAVIAGDDRRAGPALVKFSSLSSPKRSKQCATTGRRPGQISFYLDPEVPYVVGAHAERALERLLAETGVPRSDISQWIVHSGGKKVIDAVRANLGLSRRDVRHTTGVLRDHGNLSSGSFLFSYERLQADHCVGNGDYGVLMTMGPDPRSKWRSSAGSERIGEQDDYSTRPTWQSEGLAVTLQVDGSETLTDLTRAVSAICDQIENRHEKSVAIIEISDARAEEREWPGDVSIQAVNRWNGRSDGWRI